MSTHSIHFYGEMWKIMMKYRISYETYICEYDIKIVLQQYVLPDMGHC